MAKTQLKFNQLLLNSSHFAVDINTAGQINIAAGGVDTTELATGAVTGAKIADDSIDSNHYVDGSIDTAHIADAQITLAKMAADSVDSDQYVDGSIDTAHIADNQVTADKLDDLLTDNSGSAGSYGSASNVATFTVDAQGRLSAAGNVSILTNTIDTFADAANDVGMGSNKITGLANGTNANDAINKSQLDAAIAGLRWKEPVVAKDQYEAVDDATLSGSSLTVPNTDIAIFDQPLQVNDRVLITQGSSSGASQGAKYNGIWEVEQVSQGAGFELTVLSSDPADYGSGDRLITVQALNAAGDTIIQEVLTLENVSGGDPTGDETGDGKIVVQLNGLSSVSDIRDQIKSALENSNCVISSLATFQSVDSDKIDIKLKYAIAADHDNDNATDNISVKFGSDIYDHFNVNIGGSVGNPSSNAFQEYNDGSGIVLQRPEYADAADELISAAVFVSSEDEAYTCTNDAIATLNTTNLEWVQFTGLGNITAGVGISKAGNTLDIETVRIDASLTLASGEHNFGSTYDSNYWNAVQTHSMTMVFLNGVLLEPSATEGGVGGSNSGDGDYFLKMDSTNNHIKLDTTLALDGDKITLVFASQT